MVVAAAATWGVAASPAFGVRATDVSGVAVTTDAEVDAVLALGSPPPERVHAGDGRLRSALEAIPSIARADVHVTLPGTLRVRIVERTPILAWRAGAALLLVDRDGGVIADAGSADATAAARAIAAGLPTVDDRRVPAPGPAGAVADAGRRIPGGRRPARSDRAGRGDAPAVPAPGRRRVVGGRAAGAARRRGRLDAPPGRRPGPGRPSSASTRPRSGRRTCVPQQVAPPPQPARRARGPGAAHRPGGRHRTGRTRRDDRPE